MNGDIFYGMTQGSSQGGGGTFSYNISNSTFTPLYTFGNYQSDGANPSGDLLLVGNTLYGTTPKGGSLNAGTIFSVAKDGSDFTTLYSFQGGSDASPEGALIVSGNTLYGMTYGIFNPVITPGAGPNGGVGGGLAEPSEYGEIFSIGIDGSNYTVLYTFTNSADGAYPLGGLTISNTTLYGLTSSAGANVYGTLFSFDLIGSTLTPLYSFADGADGGAPTGSLLLSGSILYGTTSTDTTGKGTLFQYDTSGPGFSTIYTFTGAADGFKPLGSLIQNGSVLYGMTSDGSSSQGTLFSFDTNGSNLTPLYSFTDGADGGAPTGSLMISGSKLYGMTSTDRTGNGTLFQYDLNASSLSTLYTFTGLADGANPNGSLIVSPSGTFFGMTSTAGSNGAGTVFSF